MKVTPLVIKLSDSILSYLRLWTYLNRKIEHRVTQRKTIKISSCKDFYNGIAIGKIKDGDKILMKDFFLTEWIPRLPGACASWTRTGKEGIESYSSLAYETNCYTHGVIRNDWTAPIYGSFRLPLNKEKYLTLGAVTTEEYLTDLGIIVLVSKSVYSNFLSRQSRFNAVEADIEAYVSLTYPSNSTMGFAEKKDNSFDPVLIIDSPIQIKLRTHNTHPKINAPIFRLVNFSEKPVIGTNESGQIEYGELNDIEMVITTMTSCDPDELASAELIAKKIIPASYFETGKSIAKATDFASHIIDGSSTSEHLDDDFGLVQPLTNENFVYMTNTIQAMLKEEEYEKKELKESSGSMEDHNVNEIQILTEFDGRRSVLQPVLPIKNSVESNAEEFSSAKKIIEESKKLEDKKQ